MMTTSSLSRALDESVAALADAIEIYYRSSASNGTSSTEVREALARAMKWLSEASRLEFEQRCARQDENVAEPTLDGVAWQSQSSSVH